jgi:S1-C subfamily serine protease
MTGGDTRRAAPTKIGSMTEPDQQPNPWTPPPEGPATWPPQPPPSWPPAPPGGPLGGGGWDPPYDREPPPPPREWPRPPETSAARRVVAAIAAVVLVLASAGIGALLAVAVEDGRAARVTLPTRPGFTDEPAPRGAGGIDVEAIARAVVPAIVNINTTTSRGRAAGTGMVISPDGDVITNNHVIADATEIEVDIGGGSRHRAQVVGYDVADDIALIRVEDVSGMPTVTFGDAATVRVGDPIVTIGNAGGRGGEPTVRRGKVTGLNQQVTAGDPSGGISETLRGMIQIDAPIQPGDSGGALLDADGKVIGMNTAAAPARLGRRGGTNVGFAIPADMAERVASQIQRGIETDGVYIGSKRALLGVQVYDTDEVDDPSLAPAVGAGALVVEVEDGSAADLAGIVAGDVIVSVGGEAIADKVELRLALTRYHPGETVEVAWVARDGTSDDATVRLGEGPPA